MTNAEVVNISRSDAETKILEIIKKGFKDEVDRTRSTYEKVNLPPPEYNESSIEKEWIPQITDWDDITLIERLTQFENITGLPGNQYVLI